jgi:hypothetical protein
VRLRFDRVAQHVIACLEQSLADVVPDGAVVIVTISAPIRLPAKTVATVEERVRSAAVRSRSRIDADETIHGNAVHVETYTGVAAGAPKVIGFVHNAESDVATLLDVTRSTIVRAR